MEAVSGTREHGREEGRAHLLRAWVDVSRTAMGGRRRNKRHVVFDGEGFLEVERLTELGDRDEVYIDSLFPEFYDELAELLGMGVGVYLLRDGRSQKETRERLELEKSDRNDARALSLIPKGLFKQLRLEEVEAARKLQPLLQEFEATSRKRKTVRTWMSMEGDKELEARLRALDEALTKKYKKLQRGTTRIAREILPMYAFAKRELGLGGVGLVKLLLKIDFSKGIRKVKAYARRSRYVRDDLARFAMAVYYNAKKGHGHKNYIEIVEGSRSRDEALKRLQTQILRDLRRLYRNYIENSGQAGHSGPAT